MVRYNVESWYEGLRAMDSEGLELGHVSITLWER